MRNGGGFTTGTVLSKDTTSLTIKGRDGGSKVVFFSDKTSVTKSVEGTVADLSIGNDVAVTGTLNTDGSVTAQSVQIRPTSPPAPKQ